MNAAHENAAVAAVLLCCHAREREREIERKREAYIQWESTRKSCEFLMQQCGKWPEANSKISTDYLTDLNIHTHMHTCTHTCVNILIIIHIKFHYILSSIQLSILCFALYIN